MRASGTPAGSVASKALRKHFAVAKGTFERAVLAGALAEGTGEIRCPRTFAGNTDVRRRPTTRAVPRRISNLPRAVAGATLSKHPAVAKRALEGTVLSGAFAKGTDRARRSRTAARSAGGRLQSRGCAHPETPEQCETKKQQGGAQLVHKESISRPTLCESKKMLRFRWNAGSDRTRRPTPPSPARSWRFCPSRITRPYGLPTNRP